MRIAGIDPGISGGIVMLSPDGVLGERMPVMLVNKKKTLDLAAIEHYLAAHAPDHIVIERQQSMPRQGVSSSWRNGFHYGLLLGLLHGRGWAFTEVRAAVWKKALSIPADKSAARHRASQIFPRASFLWAKACEDGIAEAALMAYWFKNKRG